MAAEEYIRIKPNPLTNLTITSGNDTLAVSDMSTYYILGLYYNETYPIVISADGYNSVTISDRTDWSNHTVSEEGDRLLTLKPSHLYAWTVDAANENKITPSSYKTLYTSLQNLSDVQDFYSIKFYNSSGEEINVNNIYHEDDPLDDVYNVDNEKVQLRFDM